MSVSLNVAFCCWQGREICSLLQNIDTSSGTHPVHCSEGSGHSFLVGKVVGWPGCVTDHPPLSIRGLECNCTSSHPICQHNMHRDVLPYWMMLGQSYQVFFRWVVCVA
jgi:hypothetical protein